MDMLSFKILNVSCIHMVSRADVHLHFIPIKFFCELLQIPGIFCISSFEKDMELLCKYWYANSTAGQQGRGQLSISWKTPSPDRAGSYQVTLGSASRRGPSPVCMLPTVLEKWRGM